MASTIKVNTIQNTCGADIIKESGNTITIGASGDTITLASGASQSGFGSTGGISWQTSIKTSNFTAVSNEGYFVDTSGGSDITVTLPASPSAGNVVAIKDYARTFGTNKVILNRNGSNMDGNAANTNLETDGQSVILVFMDSTKGWSFINEDTTTSIGAAFMTATGGNTTITCGNFKTHIFTGPGTFEVTCAGNSGGSNTVDYLVVAGGGSAGGYYAAGGAGGFRLSNGYSNCAPTMSPLANPTGLPVSVASYPITVGAGGAAGPPGGAAIGGYNGNNGSNSVFAGSSTITSAGGGFGAASGPTQAGGNGGSGGSSGYYRPACGQGQGNTPPVSPPQGNPAGRASYANAGGGGGAGAAGSDGTINGSWNTSPVPSSTNVGGAGGVGSYIPDGYFGPTAPSYGDSGPVSNTRYFSGGGGGGVCTSQPGPSGAGGAGGGADGKPNAGPFGPAQNGTANTGGGGGGSGGGLGGSGIVIIRYKFQ